MKNEIYAGLMIIHAVYLENECTFDFSSISAKNYNFIKLPRKKYFVDVLQCIKALHIGKSILENCTAKIFIITCFNDILKLFSCIFYFYGHII